MRFSLLIDHAVNHMNTLPTTRRDFLHRASGGFGAVALAGLVSEMEGADRNPLAPQFGHHAAKADRVIFLFSTGGGVPY